VHNLIGGDFKVDPYSDRPTPYLMPYSTQVAGLHDNPLGDDRYLNYVFVGRADLAVFEAARMPMHIAATCS
jgi:hypothetical protein